MKPFRHRVAWLLLCALFAVQVDVWASWRHAAADDDAACAAMDGAVEVGPHHRGGPQVEAPVPAGPADHCVLCHLHHAFGSVRVVAVATVVPPRTVVRLVAADRVLAAGTERSPFVPRGPPTHSS